MKTFIITTIIIEIIQFISFLVILMTDHSDFILEDDKKIKSKKDVLMFFIPYFWVPLVFIGIVKWWKNLK